LCILNLAQFDESRIVGNGLCNESGCFCFALCGDDDAFLLLDSLLNDVFGSLSLLLGNLLALNSRGELWRKGQVCLPPSECRLAPRAPLAPPPPPKICFWVSRTQNKSSHIQGVSTHLLLQGWYKQLRRHQVGHKNPSHAPEVGCALVQKPTIKCVSGVSDATRYRWKLAGSGSPPAHA